ncbi:MAG: energy transducer TonB [Aurantibacter sp.]
MEPKKNPSKDLNKRRGLYFLAGLALAMLLTYIALEWKTYDNHNDYDIAMNIADELMEEVPVTEHLKTPPPVTPPVTPPVIEIVEDEKDIEESVIESTETNQDEEVMEVEEVEVAEVDEDVPVDFIVVEDVPVFPGCEHESDKRACFQKMIGKHVARNFRYPEIAQEMGVQGRVYIRFVIQKDGSIGSVEMRGPDKNLEKEAARIIGKLPKMTPGKQRGRAVRVPFSLPITFKLQ